MITYCHTLELTSLHAAQVQVGHLRFLERCSIHVDGARFGDVVRQLASQEHLNMELDSNILAENVTKVPVTLHFDDISLQSILNILCESVTPNIQYQVNDAGQVLFLTSEKESEQLFDKEYLLTGLGSLASDPGQLTQVILWTTPGPWEKLDGVGGEIFPIERGVLKVRQSQSIHKQIANLFLQLASASSNRPFPLPSSGLSEARLQRALDTVSAPPHGKISLKGFLSNALGSQGIPYWLSPQALKDIGVSEDVVLSLDGKARPLRETLQIALHPLKLSFEIEDEVVKIRPVYFAENRMITKVYDIQKQVSPTRSSQEIMATLESDDEVGRWFNVDGEGGTMVAIGSLLVIRQTISSHEKIAAILNKE